MERGCTRAVKISGPDTEATKKFWYILYVDEYYLSYSSAQSGTGTMHKECNLHHASTQPVRHSSLAQVRMEILLLPCFDICV